MKLCKYLSLTVVLFNTLTTANAQQDSQSTQYMYNTNIVNPAYAGSRGVLSVFGKYRAQWIGLEGAPKTAAISIHTPLGDSKFGLGVSFINEQIGAMNEDIIALDISYVIFLNHNYKLSFGIKGSTNLLNVDYTKLNIYHPNDIYFQENLDNQITPNLGAGFYLHSEKSYLGFSVPHFFANERYEQRSISTMKQKMNFYFLGGYVFDCSPYLKFKPAFLVKTITGAGVQMDLTANFLIHDKLTLGAGYRSDVSVNGLIGLQISPGLFIGYSYDADTTRLSPYNSGSHEIFIRFELFKRLDRIMSPRFF